jgi:hypothetical protein
MCMQCMATAMATVGTASGLRAWIGNRLRPRLGERGLRRLTIALFAAAVVASGLTLGGSG